MSSLPIAPRKTPKKRPTIEPETRDLSTERMLGNLLVTADGTWAWYRLGDVPWAFRSSGERSDLLNGAALRWSELAGPGLLHIRVTSHPMPYSVWAKNLHENSPRHLEKNWDKFLEVSQDRIAESRLDTPGVYVGVRISKKRLTKDDLRAVLGERANTTRKKAATVLDVKAELIRTTEVMSREAFLAEPVTDRDLGWLIQASMAPDHPVDSNALAATGAQGWGEHDMDSFTAPVAAYAKPLSGTVAITASREGKVRTNHVAVGSLVRLSPRDTDHPILAPWMAFTWKFPFPVEWSAIVKVIGSKDMKKKAAYDLTRAKSILRSYREDHAEEPPAELGRAIALAEQIDDEVNTGHQEDATRIVGPIRFMVSGDSEAETLARMRAVASAYSSNEQRFEVVHHVTGQFNLYREFIPGEEHKRTEHISRRLKASYFATAVPNAATGLGDDQGPYLGQVIGSSRQACMFDPCFGPMNPLINSSGMCMIGGEPGVGKSGLGGNIADGAVRRGWHTIIFDPSGPMARLTTHPDLADVSQHIDLSGANPGTLNPYRLVPVPQRGDFKDAAKWVEAVAEAKAERRELMMDTLNNLLVYRTPEFSRMIEKAVAQSSAEFTANPWAVVYDLERRGDVGKEVADMLRSATELKGGRLIFPEEGAPTSTDEDLPDALLTVLTMPGLTTPAPGTSREDWTRSERMGVVTLHLAARFAQRTMYADQLPKVIIVDEGGIAAAAGSSFQTFVLRASRDSRKHNTFFALLVQNPADALAVSPEISNLLGTVFMGKIKGAGARKAALELLGVETGVGYEGIFGNLRSGEFVMRDYYGRVDTMRVDMAHRPDLTGLLYTTPPSQRPADDIEQVRHELVLAR